MLEDRDYMRSSPFDSRRSLTVTLVITLIALFVVQFIVMTDGRVPVFKWFALSLDGFQQKHYWQFLTFQFLHSYPWPWHVLFNCLTLYFVGRVVEDALGRREFLILYLTAGVVGGAVQLLAMRFLPGQAGGSVVGASAGIMGLLAAFCTLYPMREITYFIYFFPVTIRAKYLLWAALGFSLYSAVRPSSNVADAAHLGGLLVGVAWIWWRGSAHQQLSRWAPFQSRQRKLELVKAASVRHQRPNRPKRDLIVDLPSEEFITREVDPILDKISAHGIQSLTERERQILEAARAKMSKR